MIGSVYMGVLSGSEYLLVDINSDKVYVLMDDGRISSSYDGKLRAILLKLILL